MGTKQIFSKPSDSLDENYNVKNNLGTELADMSEASITDKQATVLSKMIGEGFEENIKVEVKNNLKKQTSKIEKPDSNIIDFSEEFKAETQNNIKKSQGALFNE